MGEEEEVGEGKMMRRKKKKRMGKREKRKREKREKREQRKERPGRDKERERGRKRQKRERDTLTVSRVHPKIRASLNEYPPDILPPVLVNGGLKVGEEDSVEVRYLGDV